MLRVKSDFTPSGDQPTAIRSLVDGLESGLRYQTLLGATGTGKSVAWHEPVTVEVAGEVRRLPIGELIDGVFGTGPQEHPFMALLKAVRRGHQGRKGNRNKNKDPF